eukprot:scaffold1261_cov377-Prasinococcus_capsulatus_cf.AAC.1
MRIRDPGHRPRAPRVRRQRLDLPPLARPSFCGASSPGPKCTKAHEDSGPQRGGISAVPSCGGLPRGMPGGGNIFASAPAVAACRRELLRGRACACTRVHARRAAARRAVRAFLRGRQGRVRGGAGDDDEGGLRHPPRVRRPIGQAVVVAAALCAQLVSPVRHEGRLLDV